MSGKFAPPHADTRTITSWITPIMKFVSGARPPE
jgi:hypothetical protein